MIPINIAITGHRDIEKSDIKLYQSGIENILKCYQKKYPYSKIQVLSGMAEGADIIAAQTALKLGCSLTAVLPMSKDDYIKTFDGKGAAKKEFERTLAKADRVIDLSKVYKDADENNDAYVHLGVYLIEHAQRIIALWNGVHSGKPGGTSSVIKFALEGMPRKYRTKYRIIERYDTVPVHHVNVKRETQDNGTKPEYIKLQNDGCTTLYPKIWENSDTGKMTDYYDSQLKEIDTFNKHCANQKVIKGYLKGSDDKELTSTKGIHKIIDAQKAADTIAGKWQRKTVGLLVTQLLFGFFVFFWVALVDEIIPFTPYVLFLSPLFFLLCVLTFKYVSKRSLEKRYYDYRALAELLRIQFYWKSAGISQDAYASYSKKDAFELAWIINAAKNISMDINYELSSNNDTPDTYKKIKEYWMADQLKYFTVKNKENRKKIKRSKNLTYIFFGAGLLFVVLLIAERLVVSSYMQGEFIMHLLLFSIDVSLAGGAIFSGYLNKRQFESELKQYLRMTMIFNQGIKEFELVSLKGINDEIANTIIELGCDALSENADWVVYNRMNNIDIPLG